MEPILHKLVKRDPDLEACVPELVSAFDLLKQTFAQGGKVLVCGNGGSAADSEHIVGELMKGYSSKRPLSQAGRDKLRAAWPQEGDYLAAHLQGALPAISLVSQVSLASAFANDIAPDMVFAQQVFGYARPGDALVGISTSGRSRNVLHALRVARALGVRTIGFMGPTGGEMQTLCDAALCVPGTATAEIQERHQMLYHALCALLENEFFPEK